jgi:hypothetical protein
MLQKALSVVRQLMLRLLNILNSATIVKMPLTKKGLMLAAL